jgi:2-iminobutanoate/2-iminopropanoate deaminase
MEAEVNPTPEYPQLPDTPTSHLPFSPCVKVGQFVFVSGQASVDKTGKIVVDTFEGEFRRSMANLVAILKAAGCTLADVVQTRNYVDRKDDVAEFNRLYREYFNAPFPARTTITDCFGGNLKFEIDCIAVSRG